MGSSLPPPFPLQDAQKYEFFDTLESSQYKIKLPPPVDEYYQAKDQAIASGWAPGSGKPSDGSPGQRLGQALMKRAISDIPLIQHMQREAQGMYRLHNKVRGRDGEGAGPMGREGPRAPVRLAAVCWSSRVVRGVFLRCLC